MEKSVVVRVDRIVLHRRYRRYVRRSAKFMAHDEKNQCNVGDTVEIVETRPLSLRKRWRVRKIVRSALGTETPQAAQG
jgi:small subunit ribosomal protein S17